MQTTWKRNSSRKRPRATYGNLIALIRGRLQEDPNDVRLRHSLATHLGRAGRYGEAIAEAEKLVELAPEHSGAKRLLLGLRLHRFLRGSRA
jgi:Flp pilus assembly protein TadD